MNETERPTENAAPPTEGAPPSPSPAPAAQSEQVEVVRKVYARNLREKERIQTVFKVTKKNRITARSGKVFLAVTLADKTGEVDGRVFDRVEELEPRFNPDDYVLVEGNVIAFHGKLQVVLEKVERLDPEPLDPREFTPPPSQPEPQAQPTPAAEETRGSGAVGQIRELVERVQDPNVKALLLAFMDDPEIAEGLKVAPAAKGIHHAYKGGLAEHILSVMRLVNRVADHYPMVDRDLLMAGALLHDIGKVREISWSNGFEYTDEGRLVGHLVMTAQKIREKASRIPNFPPLLEHHITHIVLAHHGYLEYGSPKVPMTLEAYIVHALDSLDSRIASWLEAMARDPNERWTDVVKLYDRHLWKGPVPTTRNRSPVEGRRRKEKKQKPQPSERSPAVEAAEATPSQPRREERRDREERKEREERRERREREPKPSEPSRLTFKPLAALAGELQPKKEAEVPPRTEGGGEEPAQREGEPQA